MYNNYNEIQLQQELNVGSWALQFIWALCKGQSSEKGKNQGQGQMRQRLQWKLATVEEILPLNH